MGMNMSFMGGKGPSTSQMLGLVINILHKRLLEKDIKDFESFNDAILDIFNTINKASHGKHHVAPSRKDIKDLFEQWKLKVKEEGKAKIFTKFMYKNVNLGRVDDSMIITAIMAPPTAMVAKRTGQKVPQLKLLKAIPDVLFVPSVTVLALVTVKILKITFMRKKASKDAKEPHMDDALPAVQQSEPGLAPAPPQPPLQPTVAPTHEPLYSINIDI